MRFSACHICGFGFALQKSVCKHSFSHETEGWVLKYNNIGKKGLINVLNSARTHSSNGLFYTLKLINLVIGEVNILLLPGDKVRSGRFGSLCCAICSFNARMRWPFMVAFSTTFNAFIFTKAADDS